MLLPAAFAQPHESRRGDLVLRASSVSSESINPGTAAHHGIQVSPRQMVLNVVLLRGADRKPIPAVVTATARNLAGVRTKVALAEVKEGGRVSYIGSYGILPNERIRLEIRARPRLPARAPTLSLAFLERAPSGAPVH